MTEIKLESFAKSERMTVPAATKLTPSEHREVVEVIDDLRSQGLEVTLSSLTRTALVSWAQSYKAAKLESD